MLNPENDRQVGQVALPFNENQFKDFIISLLGKPQTITKRIPGTFEVTKEDLIQIFQVLNQRITQQNDSKLIQFRATIYYNDNSTTTLTGFDHLVNYNEQNPLVSIAVHVTWQFLLKFNNKESYEKQEISISFNSDSSIYVDFPNSDSHYHYADTAVTFRISHTARTWGADIEALLTKHLSNLTKKPNKFIDTFKYNSESAISLYFGTIGVITIIFLLYNTNLRLHNTTEYSIIEWVHYYGSIPILFYIIYVIQKISVFFLEELTFYSKPSFVLLTSQSFKNKVKRNKKYKSSVLCYFGTAILTIILGIITNYLYAKIFS